MKTAEEILKLKAKENGFGDRDDSFLDALYYGETSYGHFRKIVNEAAIAYATMAIEEQKKSCLTAYYVSAGWKDADNRVADAINNAPNVELK